MFREESKEPDPNSIVILCPGDADDEGLSGWDVVCGKEGPVLLTSSISAFEERTAGDRPTDIEGCLEVKRRNSLRMPYGSTRHVS